MAESVSYTSDEMRTLPSDEEPEMPADDKWQTYGERLWTTAEVKMVLPSEVEQDVDTVTQDDGIESDVVVTDTDSLKIVLPPVTRRHCLTSLGRRILSVCRKLCCCGVGCKKKN
uniref:Uncharacterized protein n=1 Tax=Schizaphis graminum TaxID=13262 RepID=A0A2S2PF38_SCHGA